MPKTQNNCILLVFDGPISLPAGNPVTIVPIGGGGDVAGSFAFTVESTSTSDDTLKCVEQGQVLSDLTWYRIEPTAQFAVSAFVLDLCTLRGDANGDGMVLANDYNVVKVHVGETVDCCSSRADLNGDCMVLANDYNVVKVHVGNEAPAKPGAGAWSPLSPGHPDDQPGDDLLPPLTTCGQAGALPLVGLPLLLAVAGLRRRNRYM